LLKIGVGGDMYFLATGVFTDRSKLGPLLQAERDKLHELQREGVVPSAYYRPDGGGVVLIVQVPNVEDAHRRMGELPFVKVGLLVFEFVELIPL
jgi:hypothetical protein